MPGSTRGSPTVIEAHDTLNAFLVRLQGRGWLTPKESDALRKRWSGTVEELPLPPSEAVGKMPSGTLQAAALEILNLARLKAKPELREALEILAAMRLRQLADVHERIQDDYELKALIFATRLESDQITLRSWHVLMLAAILALLARQSVLASAGNLDVDELAELDRIAERETSYLARFADDLALSRLQGKPMSVKQIASRAQLYAGTARGQFYRGIERRPGRWPEQVVISPLAPTDKKDERWGWVSEYIARDDDNTCGPCKDAQGYWLPGSGPFPGTACLGRARCRCRRVLRYLPEVYLELTKRAA